MIPLFFRPGRVFERGDGLMAPATFVRAVFALPAKVDQSGSLMQVASPCAPQPDEP